MDWDEELKKTKRIQRRGMGVSLLSLVVALGFIGGSKFYNPEVSIGKILLPAMLMIFALSIVVFVLRRWKK